MLAKLLTGWLMSPRSEYLVSLVAEHPSLVWVAFLSLMLCLSVFLASTVGKKHDSYVNDALLPLKKDDAHES